MIKETSLLLQQVIAQCPKIEGIDQQESAHRILEAVANFEAPAESRPLIVTPRMLMCIALLPPDLFSVKIIMAEHKPSLVIRSIRRKAGNLASEIYPRLYKAHTNPTVNPRIAGLVKQIAGRTIFTTDGNDLIEGLSFEHIKPCCLGGGSNINNLWIIKRKLNNSILNQITTEQLQTEQKYQLRPFLIVGPNETAGPVFFCDYMPPSEKMQTLKLTMRNFSQNRRLQRER